MRTSHEPNALGCINHHHNFIIMRDIDLIYKQQADVYEMHIGSDSRNEDQIVMDAVRAMLEPYRHLELGHAIHKVLGMSLNIHELAAAFRVLSAFSYHRDTLIKRYMEEVAASADTIIAEAEWVDHIKPSIRNAAEDIAAIAKNLL